MKFSTLLLASAALLVPQIALAQPAASSPNQFGDRQSGQWGDPGDGHFGDPGKGNFDNAGIKEPPAGTVPQGKVYTRSALESSEYLSLPAEHVEDDAVVAEPPKAAEAPKAQPKKKRKVRKSVQ